MVFLIFKVCHCVVLLAAEAAEGLQSEHDSVAALQLINY